MSQAAQDLDDGETHHEPREAEAREQEEVQWTKHASRSDSQAQQPDLTSREGLRRECVYARCPHHRSTTTNTAQPQGLALCSRCHPSEGTPVRPGKDTHGTLGPEQRGGRGWPTPTAQNGEVPHAPDSPKHMSSDKQKEKKEKKRKKGKKGTKGGEREVREEREEREERREKREDRRQKTEDRRQKTEDRRQKRRDVHTCAAQ